MEQNELVRFEMRVINWGRYVRSSWTPARCGSAEGHYLPERQDDEAIARMADAPVFSGDGELLERGICQLPCIWTKKFLKARYVEYLHPKHLCRVLKLHPDLYQGTRMRVLGEVERSISDIEHRGLLIKRGSRLWCGIAT